jgi:putative pyrroloquinoline-quinone-binding quinoprotein
MKRFCLSSCLVLVAVFVFVGAGCSGGTGSNCPTGQTLCSGVCVDTSSNADHCGVCSNACLSGQYCQNSKCESCTNECTFGDQRCAPGTTDQFQTCGDPDNDTCLEWEAPQACPTGQICDFNDHQCKTSCEDECSRIGAQACDSEGANGFRVCGDLNGDDCLEWGPLNGCGVGYTCSDGECSEDCQQECPAQNDLRCAAPPYNGFETCGNWDADSCLEWGSLTLCPGGQTCAAGECSADCTDDCTSGERICQDAGFRTCGHHDADTCLDWSAVTNCESWEVCNVDTGMCETACTSPCTQGQKQCSGEKDVELCANYDADPCLEWGVIDTCLADEICENGICVEDCKDECEPQGERICDDTGYRICGQHDTDSCLEYSDITPCEDGETCSAGICSETCEDECDVGERECFGAGWHQCGEAGDGDSCTDWLAVTACEAWELCNEATGECVDNCPSECTQGAKQCNDMDVELCANHDADPCLEWGVIDTCLAGERCEPTDPQCVDDCIDECDTTGDRQCNGDDAYETCGDYDADSCLEWGNSQDCQTNWICSNGICEETCSDECTTDTPPITVCEGTIGWRVCDYLDADECLDLGAINYCGGIQECQGGTCVDICTDECVPGTQVCDGNDVQICADFDGDPCVEMGVMATCSGGNVCYRGDCVSDTPAATLLINEILYDDQSFDKEQVFIELWGPSGLILDNFSVVGINGSSGEEYSRVDLDGFEMPADGHFVIAHTETELDDSWIDLKDNAADLQNGPDSVIVQWAGQVTVDALGYEGDGGGSVPVVEGTPAEEAPYDNTNEIGYCLSRGADHADTDDNYYDFLKRTMCTPGWEGPGAVLWVASAYGGIATPAVDSLGDIYTVDSWGWPTKIDGSNDHGLLFNSPLPGSGVDGLSSMALSWDELTVYVGSSNGLFALDSATGDPLDSWGPVSAGCEVYSTPAVDPVSAPQDGWLYFGANCAAGAELVAAASDGTVQWSFPADGPIMSSPLHFFGDSGEDLVVYGEGDDGLGNFRIVCVDNTDGTLEWEYPTGGACNSSPALGSDLTTVYIGCDDGMLYALDGALGTIKSGFPVAIHDGSATTTEVDGCSATIAPGADGMDYIFMTSRADVGNAYLFRDDGTTDFGLTLYAGNSSATIAADASWLVHSANLLLGFNILGGLEWYAVLDDTFMNWIGSSPTMPPLSTVVYVLEYRGTDSTGNLYAIQGSAELFVGSGSYPKFRGDWWNTGWGF